MSYEACFMIFNINKKVIYLNKYGINFFSFLIAICFFLAFPPLLTPVYAYIGPGAGIAFFSSFLVFFLTFLLALALFLFWPIRLLILRFKKRKIKHRLIRSGMQKTRKAVIIGLDGMDPELAHEFMEKGTLPNFSKLKDMGMFSSLKTTCPPISPVAWSSFSTGTNPARHGIYDFFTRDKHTYLPTLSSVHIGKPKRSIDIGKYRIPLGKPDIRFLRKGVSFWKILGDIGIPSSIIRVPVTFPPEKFSGRLLSAMCVPDLKGTQGSFTFFTNKQNSDQAHVGGTCIQFKKEAHGRFSSYIPGPENTLLKKPEEIKIPFCLTINGDGSSAILEIQRQKIGITKRTFSEWIRLSFDLGFGKNVSGIARFYAMSLDPEKVDVYLTPINIDPEYPALPISSPYIYSVYLSRLIGPYATLGLAEDTWALNEQVIDEDAFLRQCYLNHDERELMFFHELDKVNQGVCCCVFDTTDRIQHMFWRYRDGADHPALYGKDPDAYKWVLEDLYKRMDSMLGRVMERIDDKTLLMVISDHGFKSFRRGVNLNTWLYQNGYLVLKDRAFLNKEWLQGVDWTKTRAFTLGLSGIFINIEGRESNGIVMKGKDVSAIKEELIGRLSGLLDDETGKTAITSVYDTSRVHHGPYSQDGPELIIGYGPGYRTSWEAATGTVTDRVFCDNIKSWSGDHCIDPVHVPGVIFCNRKIKNANPRLIDIAPTILWEFGLNIPPNMEGIPLFR